MFRTESRAESLQIKSRQVKSSQSDALNPDAIPVTTEPIHPGDGPGDGPEIWGSVRAPKVKGTRAATHAIGGGSGPGLDPSVLDSIPRTPGVLDVRAASDATLAIWVTADLRALVQRRLLAGNPADHEAEQQTENAGDTAAPSARPIGSPRADLRSVAAAVRWLETGSLLEAEAAALIFARDRLPDVHQEMAARWAPAWLALDAGGARGAGSAPRWRVGLATDAVLSTLPRDRLVGPFVSIAEARSVAQLADEAAELCRYPNELAKSPSGTSCAYKDMGRCPGACDGSEPMDAYRARMDITVTALRTPGASDALNAMVGGTHEQIDAAASVMEFERAAALKARLDAIEQLIDESARVGSWSSFAAAGLFPTSRRAWVRVLRYRGGTLTSVASVRLDDITTDDITKEAVIEHLLCGRTEAAAADRTLDPATDAAITALVMRELSRSSPMRARGVWIGPLAVLSASDRRTAIRRAIRELQRSDPPETRDPPTKPIG